VNLEQLALLAVVVFGIGAVLYAFKTIRSVKGLQRRRDDHRPRRLISSPASAKTVAEGLIKEVSEKHGSLVERARREGVIGPELLEALEEPRQYFRERVEVRCRPMFNAVIDERILGREPEADPDEPGAPAGGG